MSGVMSRCDLCGGKPCRSGDLSRAPAFCPTRGMRDVVEESRRIIASDERIARIMRAAAKVEKKGYGVWPRIREAAELASALGVRRVGLAFCIGLSKEAREVARYFEERGLEVVSVCCKCGAIDKAEVGIPEEDKLAPGSFEATCNPVMQALVLMKAGAEIAFTLGLCAGHDAVFTMVCKVPVVALAVKDRVTGHNPLAAIYVDYVRRRLYEDLG